MATSRPNSVSLRLSSPFIFTPMTENITQTAKFTAKATVLAVSAEICSRLYRRFARVGCRHDPRFFFLPITLPSLGYCTE